MAGCHNAPVSENRACNWVHWAPWGHGALWGPLVPWALWAHGSRAQSDGDLEHKCATSGKSHPCSQFFNRCLKARGHMGVCIFTMRHSCRNIAPFFENLETLFKHDLIIPPNHAGPKKRFSNHCFITIPVLYPDWGPTVWGPTVSGNRFCI